ncbi:DUF6545 domain-containing protein [Streptomyces sp. NPDC058157]|uniref:DUF6545 domain-containing protein n=1 Tax=Streptomyces sp. NPDC058157 TaxID=3346360 RepID=UPI0036EF2754
MFARRDLRFRRTDVPAYRRVIEIRDGWLALGGPVSPDLGPAPGPDGAVEEQARWEAARFGAALAAGAGKDWRTVPRPGRRWTRTSRPTCGGSSRSHGSSPSSAPSCPSPAPQQPPRARMQLANAVGTRPWPAPGTTSTLPTSGSSCSGARRAVVT